MKSGPSLAMTAEELTQLQCILKRYVPEFKIWAFGSRITGHHKPFSDLDLALVGPYPISLSTRAALHEALSEAAIPYKVDIVDWATTSESFRAVIEKQKIDISS